MKLCSSALRIGWIALVFACSAANAGTPLEPGFSETTFAENLPEPTSLAWAPDGSGRLFVTLKSTGVKIVQNGAVLATPFATFPQLYTESECGVLGLCFDPDFVHNHYVYIFVTVSASEQRIVRFTDTNNAGTARTTIVGNLPTLGQNHDGGALGFGQDGKIYWAIGDNGSKRGVDGNLTSLAAKVGRANADGSVPNDNPFNDGAGPNNDYIWATGFRNPFTMTFQPGTGKLFLNVVGSTPDGQTEPNSGPGYEQIFALTAGDDGGYDDYEGNQPNGARYATPFTRPFAHPLIQYKTDDFGDADQQRALTGIARSGGVATFTTGTAHPYRVGQAVKVTSEGAFNGNYVVASVPSAKSFTAPAPGSNSSTGAGGQVAALVQGGAICGGTFYDSNAWPAAYRGNLFYGDYNSGYIMRAQLDAQNHPTQITHFVSDAGGVTDTAIGPDGALYYTNIDDGTVRRVALTTPRGLIVTPSVFNIVEGGAGSFSVQLGAAPASDVSVSIHRTAGDADLDVSGTDTLVFTAANWSTPQPVTVAAAPDADSDDDAATFTVFGPGGVSEEVSVTATDTTLTAPVLSTNSLTVGEGKTVSFQVSLPAQPPRSVTLTVRRKSGSRSVAVTSGAALIFTKANWNKPHAVRIHARQDANRTNDSAAFTVAARGYAPRTLSVLALDNDPSPPAFVTTPATNAVVGLLYHYEAAASGLPTPTFSLIAAPSGVMVNSATGALTWTPQTLGDFPITLRADNGREPSADQTFTLSVNADQPPAAFITRPSEGDTVSGTNGEFFGSSSDDYATYKCEFSIDGVLTFTDLNRDGHYHFNGGHNLWDTTLLSNGPHTLRITVFDDKNQTGSAEVKVTVANP